MSVPRACFAIVLLGLALSGIGPLYPRAWLLENLPTAALLPLGIVILRRRALSDRSWVQLTLFALLHFYGAHYTYANTPLGFALRDALDLSRNHYDRVVHLAFGVLWLRPLRELAYPPGLRAGLVRELLIASAIIGAASLAYEQLEWIATSLVDPAAGIAFLGTQGDAWDAQKDATAATVGGLLACASEILAVPENHDPVRRP